MKMIIRRFAIATILLVVALPAWSQEQVVGDLVLSAPEDWRISKLYAESNRGAGIEIVSGDGGFLTVQTRSESAGTGFPSLRSGVDLYEEIEFSAELPGFVSGFAMSARDSKTYMFSLEHGGKSYVVVMGYNVNSERVTVERIRDLHETVVEIASSFSFSD